MMELKQSLRKKNANNLCSPISKRNRGNVNG